MPYTCDSISFRTSSFRGLAALAAIAAACVPAPPAWSAPVGIVAQHHPEDQESGTGAQPAAQTEAVPCVDGFAGEYPCRQVDLQSVLPMASIGGGSGSDLWGWTHPVTGREYAIVCRSTGTAFIDVTDPAEPVYVGDLPVPGEPSHAGDVKVYRGYAFIVGEASDHGMQVFNLRRLGRVSEPPETFTADAHYTGFGRAHNLALNEASGFAYPVRTNDCNGGVQMIDVRDPLNPAFAGCVDDAATHDAQCVIYGGPDADYQGREICFNSNEDHVGIVDVTDKSAPLTLSSTDYEGRGYTHQGWLTEDHAFFVVDDELDERDGDHNTRTYVWNVEDLEAPFVTGTYTGPTPAIDHNLYVKGDLVYLANYRAGMRILHIDDARQGRLSEVAYFDIDPDSDARDFGGAWTAFPFFSSGNVLVSSREALFVLRPTLDGGPGGCSAELGDSGYCERCGPCAEGQGSCRTDDECASGLVCVENFGGPFGLRRLAEVCVTPGGLALPDYAAAEMPALSADLGSIVARALNDAGQVTGEARGEGGRSAFRFTPGAGVEGLDPRGDSSSSGWTINEAGDVFGLLHAGMNARQTGFFLHRPESGFDLLDRRANARIRRTFELRGMNDAGDLAGAVLNRATGAKEPYLYTAEDGWTPLAGIDPRFRRSSTLAWAINNVDDLIFLVELAGGRSEAFALFGGDRLVGLGDFGRRSNLPAGLNDNGRVAGMALDGAGLAHAYVLRAPGAGVTDIHPRNFRESAAIAVSAKGVVGGLVAGAVPEGIFTWDPRRQRKFRVEARRAHFRTLLPAGSTFEGIEVTDVNERLEFVGRVRGEGPDGEAVERFFYFSPPFGLSDVQDLVTAAGSAQTVTGLADVNNWGEILVLFENGESTGALVLSPQQ